MTTKKKKNKTSEIVSLGALLMGAKICELAKECQQHGVKITIIIEPQDTGPLVF